MFSNLLKNFYVINNVFMTISTEENLIVSLEVYERLYHKVSFNQILKLLGLLCR